MKLRHLFFAVPFSTLLLVTLVIVFTLCVGPANSASEPGTVTIVLPLEPITLDAVNTSSETDGRVLLKNVVETLTILNRADSSITPGLATSWKQIDAKTWHFFLRKGVKFHDGEDFNAEAVVFNFKRLYNQKIDARIRLKFFARLKLEGKALDRYTVEVRLDKPEPLLPTLLGQLALCSPNTPSDKVTRNPIGTGPHKFVKWDAGTQIITERFDGYWGKQPEAKRAIYVWRTESSVRAAMVLIGEVDLAVDIAVQDANRPDMDYSYLNSNTSYLRLSAWEPPLNDRRVRMALNLAVDRNAIRGSILSKDAVPATQMVVPSILGHNPDIKAWPYDPQKARQLLNEARKDGVPVDKEILLLDKIGLHPGSGEVMEAVMNMYKAVGLNVKLKMVEGSVIGPTYENKPYPMNFGPYTVQKTHDNNSGDAVFTVFQKYHCDGNQSAFCDRQLDDLWERAQGATGEERKQLWQAGFKRVQEEIIPDVMLFHLVGYCRVGRRINFRPSVGTTNEIPLSQITFR
jgi:peptide/nickel transport system substrate-binding protein